MISQLFATIFEPALQLPSNSAVDYLKTVLANKKASAYARELLRPEFEQQVHPASYDHVISNFELNSHDFTDYYRSTTVPSPSGLANFLKQRMRDRSRDWVHNRPTDELFERLVAAFFDRYFAYFATTDPTLASLYNIGLSNDILQALSGLRDALTQLQNTVVNKAPLGFLDDVLTLLAVCDLPYRVLERTTHYADIEVTDSSGVVPSTFLLLCSARALSDSDLLSLDGRLARYGRSYQLFAVLPAPPGPEAKEFLARRMVQVLSIPAFHEMFMVHQTGTRLLAGSIAAHRLLETLNVSHLYIDPRAVIDSGEPDPDESTRPTGSAIADFLGSADDNVLFVLGDGGAGKSAVCASLFHAYAGSGKSHLAIYVPLRSVDGSEPLTSVVSRATRMAKTLGGSTVKAVVILDGVDEMPNAMMPIARRSNILQILHASTLTDKLIVSARTSYFEGLSDFWSLFPRRTDDFLWRRISQYLPTPRTQSAITALILQPFNNDQIEAYLELYGKLISAGEGYADRYLIEARTRGAEDVFRWVARNPMYLFLLANAPPWMDGDTRSIADVYRSFVRYWLVRDLEKGQSRWRLDTTDRLEFLENLVWWMFEEEITTISFERFVEFVRHQYPSMTSATDVDTMALELRTTCIFACSDELLHVALPAFFDYFVAKRFAEGRFPSPPTRCPTRKQAQILLAMVETGQASKNWLSGAADEWLKTLGCERTTDNTIREPTKGILFKGGSDSYSWPVANSINHKKIRAVIDAGLNPGKGENAVVVVVKCRHGLHARPAEALVGALSLVNPNFNGSPHIELQCQGAKCDALSILGLLSMSLTPGTRCELLFEGCTAEELAFCLSKVATRVEGEEGSEWHLKEDLGREDV